MTMSFCISLYANVLAMIFSCIVMPDADTIRGRLSEYVIVEARVVEVVGDSSSYESIQVIEHVYSGTLPEDHVEFEDGGAAEGSNFGRSFAPMPKEGQTGIWVLRPIVSGDRAILRPAVLVPSRLARSLFFRSPSRPGIDPHYADYKEFAEAIEALWNASDSRHVEMLKEYCTSKNAMLGAWAILLLSETNPDVLRMLSDRLLDPGVLSPHAQTALDQALWYIEPEWANSDRRRRLLEHWTQTAADEVEAIGHFFDRLSTAIQREQLGYDRFAKLIRAFIDRPGASRTMRRAAVRVAGQGLLRGDTSERVPVFDLLYEILTAHDEDELQALAAAQFRTFRQHSRREFSPAERERLIAALHAAAAGVSEEIDRSKPIYKLPPEQQVVLFLEQALDGSKNDDPPTSVPE